MMLNHVVGQVLAEDALTLAMLQDAELSTAVLATLQGLGFPRNLGLLPNTEASRKAYQLMQEVILSLPAVVNSKLIDTLAADYAAIYLTGALGASPYESFWLSDDHLLCQEAMWDIRAVYAAAGYAIPNWRMRPDDHLAYQLQFVSRLLADAGKDQNWRVLAAFLDFHLLRWLPDFAGRVTQYCDTPFYAALAVLTDAWCQQLRDMIAAHLDEPRLRPEQIKERLRAQRKTEVREVPLQFMPGATGPSW